MTEYDFSLYLNGLTTLGDLALDALYEAGCDDALPCSSEGRAILCFARQSESLESAIRSAIGNVQKAGFTVSQAVIECDTLAVS